MEVIVHHDDIERALRLLMKAIVLDGDLQKVKERMRRFYDPKPCERRRSKERKAMLRRKKAERKRERWGV